MTNGNFPDQQPLSQRGIEAEGDVLAGLRPGAVDLSPLEAAASDSMSVAVDVTEAMVPTGRAEAAEITDSFDREPSSPSLLKRIGRAAAIGALTGVAYTAATITKASDLAVHPIKRPGNVREMAHKVVDHNVKLAQDWWKRPGALTKLGYFAVAGLPATNFFLGEAAAGWVEGKIMRWVDVASNISEPRLAAIGVGAGVLAALGIELVCGLPVAIKNRIEQNKVQKVAIEEAKAEQDAEKMALALKKPQVPVNRVMAAVTTAFGYGGAEAINKYGLVRAKHVLATIAGYEIFSLIYSAGLTIHNAAAEVFQSGVGTVSVIGGLAIMATIGKTHVIDDRDTVIDRSMNRLVKFVSGTDAKGNQVQPNLFKRMRARKALRADDAQDSLPYGTSPQVPLADVATS